MRAAYLRDPAVAAAVARGFLAQVGESELGAFLDAGSLRSVAAGEVCFSASDRPSRGGLVVDGVFRVYVNAADGRRLTVRYARMGALAGLTTGLTGLAAPVNIQAVTAGRILEVSVDDVRALAAGEAGSFTWALAQEVSLRLVEAIESLAGASFGTLRGRLARHLLDLGEGKGDGTRLTVHATQQDLADNIGSVREVVSRLIAQLRTDGFLETDRGTITILDADRLAGLVGSWMGTQQVWWESEGRG